MIFGVSKWFYIASVLLALIFVLFPGIDLAVSSLFYNEQEGFFWAKNPVIVFIYNIPRPIVLASLIALIILLIDLIFRKRLFNFRPLVLFYIVAVMIIGPGLIVHSVFKDHWGRARPSQTVNFGGDKTFTPAFVMTDQCGKNCSFVSGHAGGAFGLIAFAMLFRQRRNTAMAVALTVGAVVGLGRIIQGGHFLSDVLFAFIFVYLTTKILYYVTFDTHRFDGIDRRSGA